MPRGPRTKRSFKTPAAVFRLVLIYILVSVAWITLSDRVVEALIDDPALQMQISTLKGWAFVLVTAALLYALVTRLVYMIYRARDNENALREYREAELEARVATRTAELQAANRELDSFAYAVSHDLRAPLRAMSGFSQALVEDHAEELSADARKWLDQIVIASSKMNELVDGLLVLSRSTRGDLDRAEVNISALVHKHLSQLQAEQPDQVLEADIAEGLRLAGDPRMLEVVINNLIDNAWKYSQGQPSIQISVQQTSLEGQDGVAIQDHGAGFDPRHADKLFQPFQRLHRHDEFPGIGIGLATVQRIIHRHGGHLKAEGRPGEGACFSFSLPALEPGAEPDRSLDQT